METNNYLSARTRCFPVGTFLSDAIGNSSMMMMPPPPPSPPPRETAPKPAAARVRAGRKNEHPIRNTISNIAVTYTTKFSNVCRIIVKLTIIGRHSSGIPGERDGKREARTKWRRALNLAQRPTGTTYVEPPGPSSS